MKNLYEVTGDVKDINILLINKKTLADLLTTLAHPKLTQEERILFISQFKELIK